MNGSDHFKKAEGLIENAWRKIGGGCEGYGETYLHAPDVRDRLIATAQVHATLAAVAAQVNNDARWVG